MITPRWLSVCLLLTAMITPAAVSGQRSPRVLRGVVVSEETGVPLSGVIVTAVPPRLIVRTDRTGAFELVGLRRGRFTIEFQRLGFARVVLTVAWVDSVQIGDLGTVTLQPIATPLEGIVVEAEAGGPDRRLAGVGFYERRQLGFGSFVDPQAIEEMNPPRFTDIVKRMSGFTVIPNQNYMRPLPAERSVFGLVVKPSAGVDTRRYVIKSRRGRQDCAPLVFVDGVWRGNTFDTDIDRHFHPSAVRAIEAYAGPASLPAEFNRDGAECGALVVWTR